MSEVELKRCLIEKDCAYSLSEFLGRFVALGLGVGGCAGEAVCLDTQVVRVHVHVEEAPVAPVGTP